MTGFFVSCAAWISSRDGRDGLPGPPGPPGKPGPAVELAADCIRFNHFSSFWKQLLICYIIGCTKNLRVVIFRRKYDAKKYKLGGNQCQRW